VILNHSTFWSTDQTTLGLEVNYRDGKHESVLLMPQLHRKLPASFNLQAGVGSEKRRGDSFRPQVGLRLVREL
jgi:hypothetical protein